MGERIGRIGRIQTDFSCYTSRTMVLGYDGRTDWADRADTNGFLGVRMLGIRQKIKKNPSVSARSAQSVLPSYHKTTQRKVYSVVNGSDAPTSCGRTFATNFVNLKNLRNFERTVFSYIEGNFCHIGSFLRNDKKKSVCIRPICLIRSPIVSQNSKNFVFLRHGITRYI
jgi:hypothetical protein